MGSRSFSRLGPQIPHLVPRRRGGLAGETLDLRLDIEEGFEHLEGELDHYIVVEDEGTDVHSGHVKLNFTGPGVTLAVDPLDPNKVDVSILGGGGGSGNVQATVSYADFPGPVSLGILAAGKVVEKAVLDIQTEFDGGVQLIVGDAAAHGRLMPADVNLPEVAGVYVSEVNCMYGADTAVYLYFIGAVPPTVGSLRAIVYFS